MESDEMLCDQMLSVKKRERESERETVPLLMDGNGCHIRCNRSSGRNDTFYAFDKWFCHQIRMNWCPWWNNTHARTHTHTLHRQNIMRIYANEARSCHLDSVLFSDLNAEFGYFWRTYGCEWKRGKQRQESGLRDRNQTNERNDIHLHV